MTGGDDGGKGWGRYRKSGWGNGGFGQGEQQQQQQYLPQQYMQQLYQWRYLRHQRQQYQRQQEQEHPLRHVTACSGGSNSSGSRCSASLAAVVMVEAKRDILYFETSLSVVLLVNRL